MSALAQALLDVQRNAPAIQKDGLNPHFHSKYVSLDTLMPTILPVLNEHGIVLLQEPTTLEGEPALRTRLIHAETGEQTETTMLLVLAKDDPQGQGSALTYARRYALMSMLGLVADEDDDGNKATPQRRGSMATGARADSNGDAAPRTKAELLKKLEDNMAALKLADPSIDWQASFERIAAKNFEGKTRAADLTVPELRTMVDESAKWLANATPGEAPFS